MSVTLADPETGIEITLPKFEQTCFACPSQWEGMTDRKERVFVHYRHGTLSVDLTPEGWPSTLRGLYKEIGDPLSGVVSLDAIAPFVVRGIEQARRAQYR